MRTLIVPLSLPHIPLDRKVLGLTLKDRIEKTARRECFGEVRFLEKEDLPSAFPDGCLVVSPGVLLSGAAFDRIKEICGRPDSVAIILNPDFAFCVPAEGAAQFFRESSPGGEFVKKLESRFKLERIGFSPREAVHLQRDSDIPSVKKWLLRNLIKDSEGFMSRNFERAISLNITRLVIDTPITPNWMTLISVSIGIAGGLLMGMPAKMTVVAGSILFWVHSVLDGCDGEIARLKFLQSRWGGILDFWSDNVVHSVVFMGIAAGWAQRSGESFPLLLGVSAVLGTMLSAGLVYLRDMARQSGSAPMFTTVLKKGSEPHSPGFFQRVVDLLSPRDFIYLVILLAIFDKIKLFLWMGAIGAPCYFLFLVFLELKNRTAAGASE